MAIVIHVNSVLIGWVGFSGRQVVHTERVRSGSYKFAEGDANIVPDPDGLSILCRTRPLKVRPHPDKFRSEGRDLRIGSVLSAVAACPHFGA